MSHQSQLSPSDNKFHQGNGENGKHYWITPSDLYTELNAQYAFDFDPCPHPLPEGFDGLTAEWGQSNYVNPPFGSIIHQGKKKGPTAWARKAIAENAKGKCVVLVYPIDKWVLMLLAAGATVKNLGDVRWLATEDGTAGKGTGRHIAAFILEPKHTDSGLTVKQALDRVIGTTIDYALNPDKHRYQTKLRAERELLEMAARPANQRLGKESKQ